MQRFARSAILAAVLAAGLATAAAAQTVPPTDPSRAAPPVSPYGYGAPEETAVLPPGALPGPAQIIPAPNDPWHQWNDERSRLEQHLGGGG
jgi:hypothetical protein